ncbi:hypothetical protein BJY04DRAFT_195357 [Aspergillus karnatakaensis]|uniref:uncharacterized protein n=1 Tax=Aspergillus karnatakaensis TaxID=1810916 RepID=UPI003CCD54C3
MPTYRIEEAPTGRAGCQNKECKDQKIKIPKGEIRFGSWVDTERIQAFYWRHWGCVTPKIIQNLRELVGEDDDQDLDLLDGYDEIPAEFQEKVQKALDQGHVADEDWKGDREMNRPGMTGFRVRTPKKAAKKKDKTEEEKSNEETPAKSSKGKAGKKVKAEESEDETPAKTSKAKKRGLAQANDEDVDGVEPAKPKRAKRKATKKAPVISDDEISDEDDDFEAFESEPEPEPEPEPKAAKKGRKPSKGSVATTRPKRGKKTIEDDGETESDETPAKKPKRGRNKST